MTTPVRLLLTGAAGGLGQALRPRLAANCEILRLSDVAPLAPAAAHEECVPADLSDAQAVMDLVAGCQSIVHLGGISVEAPWASILKANVEGVVNLYEAARVHGVKRVDHESTIPFVIALSSS